MDRDKLRLSLPMSVRVDVCALATVARFMRDNGMLSRSRSELVRDAVDLAVAMLVNNGAVPFDDPLEADEWLAQHGYGTFTSQPRTQQRMAMFQHMVEGAQLGGMDKNLQKRAQSIIEDSQRATARQAHIKRADDEEYSAMPLEEREQVRRLAQQVEQRMMQEENERIRRMLGRQKTNEDGSD